MIDILVPISLFTMIFGIYYLRTRERLAMIERGMVPASSRPNPFLSLKWGLLLIGSGLGLLAAYLLNSYVFSQRTVNGILNPVFIYFALIAIGGGAGLLISYRIENRTRPGTGVHEPAA